ncbi:hypothetical protein JOC77_002905, partial [Peribacillus deserti]|nr:hypothetical protein [Peribacillus deserti]
LNMIASLYFLLANLLKLLVWTQLLANQDFCSHFLKLLIASLIFYSQTYRNCSCTQLLANQDCCSLIRIFARIFLNMIASLYFLLANLLKLLVWTQLLANQDFCSYFLKHDRIPLFFTRKLIEIARVRSCSLIRIVARIFLNLIASLIFYSQTY